MRNFVNFSNFCQIFVKFCQVFSNFVKLWSIFYKLFINFDQILSMFAKFCQISSIFVKFLSNFYQTFSKFWSNFVNVCQILPNFVNFCQMFRSNSSNFDQILLTVRQSAAINDGTGHAVAHFGKGQHLKGVVCEFSQAIQHAAGLLNHPDIRLRRPICHGIY